MVVADPLGGLTPAMRNGDRSRLAGPGTLHPTGLLVSPMPAGPGT